MVRSSKVHIRGEVDVDFELPHIQPNDAVYDTHAQATCGKHLSASFLRDRCGIRFLWS